MSSTLPPPPPLPIPITLLCARPPRYFLFDAATISYLRREHHILGVLTGTLPQIPQQNVFLGLPLQLQGEEVRLLVQKSVAYIIDGAEWHRELYSTLSASEKAGYQENLKKEGIALALTNAAEREKKAELALQRAGRHHHHHEDTSLSNPPPPPYLITPTTTPFPAPPPSSLAPPNPASYALFAHLHSKNYYLSPGLRFGCQYLVYPGDPLRYHSHFLANALGWEEEVSVLDLVGGGRLGTGVKKGWMIGGKEEKGTEKGEGEEEEDREDEGKVRVFCVEWAGM